jgi:hypothetical protein
VPDARAMHVYYTVDTEFWPANPHQPDFSRAAEDFQRDVLGLTSEGEYGLRYQMDALEAEGLKGVFFLEALHALKLGAGFLREMAGLVQRRGHEAALHIHPEWLAWMDEHPLGGRTSQLMKDFSPSDQRWMVERAIGALRECGVNRVTSFRAGNYGANRHTLNALAAEGVAIDSSYNVMFLGRQCGIEAETPLTSPRRMEGVIEVPITFIEDYPRHYRPMQIMAASFAEMRTALELAQRRGFPSFVFVSHGFELIRSNRGGAQADGIVRRRFDQLITYLGRNKDRYRVTTFADTIHDRLFDTMADQSPVKGSAWRTSGRMVEQLVRRVVAQGSR